MNFHLPHRRFNPLTREWVLVSPQRTKRPWQGQVEKVPAENRPAYDPKCYLCPGNERASGVYNPIYSATFGFANDFSALLPPAANSMPDSSTTGLLRAESETGICRVVCFSPRHDLTLPEMAQADVETVVRTWTEETRRLSALDWIRYVQIFENKGAVMGCSNPHPHSQIWATSQIPTEPAKELIAQKEYLQEHQSCLLCDYLRQERADTQRIIVANEHFTALTPFWAVWPFEAMIVGHRHLAALPDLQPPEISALADIIRRLAIRYDNLFETSFPYSMGFHQAPTDGVPHPEWHLHLHFYPPLLRSATVKKFMVGYEMLAMPQRDITPESSAECLRNLSERHYRAAVQPGLPGSCPDITMEDIFDARSAQVGN